MHEPEQSRRQFTLLQLLVAVTAIAVVLGVSIPVVRGWQERSVRDRCSNHLRQLGITVHVHHDINSALPPLASDPDYWTWIAFLRPYYDSCCNGSATLTQAPTTPNNKPFTMGYDPSQFLCPARRQSATREAGAYAGWYPSDYVAVSTSSELKWNSQGDGMVVYRLRPLTANRATGDFSATKFSDVTDGLSNTFMIGEKHMRPEWLGGQYDEPAMVAFEDPNTIRVATDQIADKGLAQRRDDDDPWKFGSWHDGVTLFAFGDASVRAISNKTDTRTLRLLSCRNDGEPVTVP